MNNKIYILLTYIFISFVISVIIYISPINNLLISTILLLLISLYLMQNYLKDSKCLYLRELYILWILIAILINIFAFSVINIISTVIICILLFVQYKKNLINKQKKEEIISLNQEVKLTKTAVNVELPKSFDQDEFMEKAKKLYKLMQQYFMNFEYEKLKKILSNDIYIQFEKQMKHLEKNNKMAVRENIDIIDIKINKFNNEGNKIFVELNFGVVEDKYTICLDSDKINKNCRYESYYDIVLIKEKDWIIDKLKLINSRSKK